MIFKIYLFLIPIANAFNISAVITFPLVASALHMLYVLIKNKFVNFKFLDIQFVILLVLALVSMYINIGEITMKSISHIIALFTVVILFYYYTYMGIRYIKLKSLIYILYISYIAVMIFGIIEFSAINFLSFDINLIIPRPTVPEYNPGFLSIVLIRARSFFEESGYFASYIAIVFPILLYFLSEYEQNNIKRNIIILLTLVGVFISFSVSFFLFFPLAVFLALLIYRGSNFRCSFIVKKKNIFIITGIIIFVSIFLFQYYNLLELIYEESLGRKFVGNSLSDRHEKYIAIVNLMYNSTIMHFLFGYGPASYEYLGIKPGISVFLNFFRDFGFLFLIFFLFINTYIMSVLVKSKKRISRYLLVSVISMNLFFISTPHYFDPHFFFLYALFRWNNE